LFVVSVVDEEESAGEEKGGADGEHNDEGANDAVLDEEDGIDDDAGADHGVGD
jgi:hypothetical protein